MGAKAPREGRVFLSKGEISSRLYNLPRETGGFVAVVKDTQLQRFVQFLCNDGGVLWDIPGVENSPDIVLVNELARKWDSSVLKVSENSVAVWQVMLPEDPERFELVVLDILNSVFGRQPCFSIWSSRLRSEDRS